MTSSRVARILCAMIAMIACWLFVAGLRANHCAIVDYAFISFRFA